LRVFSCPFVQIQKLCPTLHILDGKWVGSDPGKKKGGKKKRSAVLAAPDSSTAIAGTVIAGSAGAKVTGDAAASIAGQDGGTRKRPRTQEHAASMTLAPAASGASIAPTTASLPGKVVMPARQPPKMAAKVSAPTERGFKRAKAVGEQGSVEAADMLTQQPDKRDRRDDGGSGRSGRQATVTTVATATTTSTIITKAVVAAATKASPEGGKNVAAAVAAAKKKDKKKKQKARKAAEDPLPQARC